jgi:protoheme IX farnesyltransferase
MTLVIFTGLCGLLAAPGHINPVLGFATICASRWARAGGGTEPVVGGRH